MIASTVGISISFALVLNGYEYWALIGVFGLKFLLSSLLSFLYLNWRPRIELRINSLTESLSFCIPLVISNVVMTSTTAFRNGLINNLIGKAELGLFSKAEKISVLPSMVIIGPLNRIVFSILSKFKVNSKEFSENYFYLAKLVGYLSYPIATILVFFPSEFITILLGQNWVIAIPVFKGLSLACYAYCAANLCRWLFLTSGNTQRLFYVNIFRLFLFTGVVLYFSKFGILAVAYAYSATELIIRLPIIYYARLGLDIKLSEIIKSQIAPLLSSLCAAIIPFLIWRGLDTDNLTLFIVIVPILYALSYILISFRQKFIQEFIANTGIMKRLKNMNFLKENS